MQTTYTSVPNASFRGMPADVSPTDSYASRAYQGAVSAAAPFGTPMVAGTDPALQCDLPATANDVFLGIATHRHIAPGTSGSNAFTGEEGIEKTQSVDLMRKGTIWVKVEEAVTPGDDVYWRATVNGGLIPGNWGKSADAGKCVKLAAAQWMSAAAAGALAMLEINIP